jgi:hypothetical protein
MQKPCIPAESGASGLEKQAKQKKNKLLTADEKLLQYTPSQVCLGLLMRILQV